MPTNDAPSPQSRQRVFLVGPEVGVLDDLMPLLDQSFIESHRASNGASALEEIRRNPPDLVFVEHPLPDMPTEEFLDAARPLVAGRLTAVVLAPSGRSEELSRLAESGEIILRSDGASAQLLAAAGLFLRKERRRPSSIVVRLGISLGNSQMLRLAQTVNLSRRGMLARTAEHFPLGSEVRFEVLLPEDDRPIRGNAVAVRHADREKERLSGVGLKFVEFDGDDEERLRAFLEPG